MGFMNSIASFGNILLDGDSSFDILKFLDNTSDYVEKIGYYVMLVAGFILILVAAVQIAKGFASGGKGQVNWVMSIGCLLMGGVLAFGGWNLMSSVAEVGANTIAEMGGMEGIGQYDEIESGATAGDTFGSNA